MTDEEIQISATAFAEKIMDTDIYRKYSYQKERLKKQPDLYAKVNEYREKTYELQNSSDQEDLFDRMDAFEKEYEKFRENPVVEGFLQSELEFCRMMQQLNEIIMDHLDFE